MRDKNEDDLRERGRELRSEEWEGRARMGEIKDWRHEINEEGREGSNKGGKVIKEKGGRGGKSKDGRDKGLET